MAQEAKTRDAILRLVCESRGIDGGRVDAVCNGVAALNRLPGVELRRAESRFFMRMPADAGGIENHVCAAESREARAFGIPLIPANLHANARVPGVEIRKAEIARREVKFFVVQRIVGNVHLAVFAEKRSVSIQHGA